MGGIVEVVKNRETGLLVPPKDPVHLAQAIAEFVNHPELARGYGEAGREFALQNFPIEKMIERYLQCYENLSQGTR